MVIGSSTSKRTLVKSIRNLQQKVHFFKWKLWKYQDASDVAFMEQNYTLVELCDKNVEAYKKAFTSAKRTLANFEERLAAL